MYRILKNNLVYHGLEILVEFAKDLIFFPIWWYTEGLFLFSKKVVNFLSDKQKSLALWVWIKNIFRPMYNQKDWQGIMISILMRVVQIILRSIAMFFWVFLSLISIFAWIFAPFYVFYQIFFQIAL
jgi:hypothetical protein